MVTGCLRYRHLHAGAVTPDDGGGAAGLCGGAQAVSAAGHRCDGAGATGGAFSTCASGTNGRVVLGRPGPPERRRWKCNDLWQNGPCGAGCPQRALLLALLCPLPVAAARAGTAIPISVRTDAAAADAVYTVELTPLDAAPAPVQCAPSTAKKRRHRVFYGLRL